MQEELSHSGASIKKFVFHLSLENAEIIDDLSKEERNGLVNSLLNDYVERDYEEYKAEKTYGLIKQVLLGLALVTIGIPLIIFIINMSINLTHSNYKDMQNNVEKLYRSRGRY